MTTTLTIERDFHFQRRGRGASKRLRAGPSDERIEPAGVPRVSRLMALAIRFDQFISDGLIANYAELAELGHVSRARITQIMNLLLLAPDIQEQVLFLPRAERGRDAIHLRQLQPIAALADWRKQSKSWRALLAGRRTSVRQELSSERTG